MRKKYLKTIDDIEALRNTDTKIFVENHGGYYKFINGVLCYFQSNGEDFEFQVGLWLGQEPYIEVEDKQAPAPEDYIGKLGWFWDNKENIRDLDFLKEADPEWYLAYNGDYYRHFRPLTPEEVEKYTGYKVVKEG